MFSQLNDRLSFHRIASASSEQHAHRSTRRTLQQVLLFKTSQVTFEILLNLRNLLTRPASLKSNRVQIVTIRFRSIGTVLSGSYPQFRMPAPIRICQFSQCYKAIWLICFFRQSHWNRATNSTKQRMLSVFPRKFFEHTNSCLKLKLLPCFQFSYTAGQFLKPYPKNLDFTYFLVSNFRSLCLIVLGYALVVAVTTILSKLMHENADTRLKRLKRAPFGAVFLDSNRLPSAHQKLIYLFFGLFLFFNLNFLSGTIKTEKISIDTEQIVDSAAKLLDTSRTLVLDYTSSNRVKTAPDGSFLKRLSGKAGPVVNTFSDFKKLTKNEVDRYAFFAVEIAISCIMSVLSQSAKEQDLVAFMKPTPYFESLIAMSMRRDLDDERKRFINSR